MFTLIRLLKVFYILWTQFCVVFESNTVFQMKLFKKYYIYIFLGQQYNLTGSSEFAVLGEAFTWTCDMFVPPGQSVNAVNFFRNQNLLGAIGYKNNECLTQSAHPKYIYICQIMCTLWLFQQKTWQFTSKDQRGAVNMCSIIVSEVLTSSLK